MKEEDRKLLLKDLCARLPYEVKCLAVTNNSNEPNTIGGYCEVFDDFYIREVSGWFNISMIKPYLRSLSSITEEERKEYNKVMFQSERYEYEYAADIDWFNAHYFDYRGLIPMGLAIEAPEGMYK